MLNTLISLIKKGRNVSKFSSRVEITRHDDAYELEKEIHLLKDKVLRMFPG